MVKYGASLGLFSPFHQAPEYRFVDPDDMSYVVGKGAG
jgi:hypothetical protein